MTIEQKLKFTALLVLVLLTASVATSVVVIERLRSNAAQLANVQEPLTQAVLEMEINAGETASAVLQYVWAPQQRDIERILDSERDFELYAAQFERLAEGEDQRRLGRKILTAYRAFKALGSEITTLTDRRSVDLLVFRDDVAKIDSLIDRRVRSAIDRSAPEALTKIEAVLDVEIDIDKVFGAVERHVRLPDTEIEAALASLQADFDQFKGRYRATRMSDDELAWLETLDRSFAEAVVAAKGLIALTDTIDRSVEQFRADIEQLDVILDEETQPLVLEGSARAAMESRELGRISIAITMIAGLIIFAIVAGVNWVVFKGIVAGLAKLDGAAVAFGRGDLDHRIKTSARDELAALADAFNDMAAKRISGEASLKNSEERLRAIHDTIVDCIITIDHRGKIASLNPAAEEQFGYNESEVIGKNVKMLMPENYAVEHDGYLANYMRTGEAKIIGIGREVTAQRKDGSVFPAELAVSQMDIAGEKFFSGSLRDISDRKAIQRDLELLVQELESKNAELERFNYTVSHDLKSPLFTITGFIGHIEKELRSGKVIRAREDVDRIKGAAHQMTQLLDQILELSRVGRVANPPESVPLANLVREALERTKGSIDASGARVTVQPDLPAVFCDPVRLVEVLQNLIENAVRFSRGASEPSVEIGAHGDDQETICWVRDNGIGIEPRHHEKVFQIFERLDAGSAGTGIGLALVKRIVNVHEGRVWIESDGKGSGTTFFFSLPGNRASPDGRASLDNRVSAVGA